MAEYRRIHTKIWKDEWVLDLEPDDKLLFVYLFSNELAAVSGIYKIPLKVIAFETGLDRQWVESALERFEQAGKVTYSEGIVWVVNLRKYNENPSPEVLVRIEKDLAEIPDCALKRRYMEYHRPCSDSDTVSIGYPECGSEQEQEQEHEQEQDQEQEQEQVPGAGAPECERVLQFYREAAERRENDLQHKLISDAVREVGADRVETAMREWLESGYSRTNVKGMVTVARNGWNKGNGSGRRKTRSGLPEDYREDGKSYLVGKNTEFVKH